MKARNDYSGRRFGLYVAIAYLGNSKWLCRCDCGNERNVFTGNLTKGQSNSCGCQKPAISRAKATRHGMSDTPIHRSWMSMRQRCQNPNDSAYKNYGGRGISICERWSSFENFMADMGAMPSGFEIERIDVNGNYEPGNCRWATIQDQGWNKRNSKLITMDGVTRCLSEWCHLTGVTKSALQKRLALGWDLKKSLTTPVRPMCIAKGALQEAEVGRTFSGRPAKLVKMACTQGGLF